MQNKLVITEMTEAHLEQVHVIFKENFVESWSMKSLREELTNDLALTTVALDGEQVIAFLNVHHIVGEGDINNIAVRADYRKQHIATALVQDLFVRAVASGISCYTLEVRVGNLSAISFYEYLGFVQVGHRRNYYSHPTEDALLYRRSLSE